jgi:5-methylcytosine-specific restriction protein A
MGKLKALAPTLSRLGSRFAPQSDAHGHSKVAEPWRNWFNLKRWKDLRWFVLVRDRFTCQWPGCGRLEPNPAKLVADHVIPHRGDPDLFWDPSNLQCLCKPCHDTRKQRAERRGQRGG